MNLEEVSMKNKILLILCISTMIVLTSCTNKVEEINNGEVKENALTKDGEMNKDEETKEDEENNKDLGTTNSESTEKKGRR